MPALAKIVPPERALPPLRLIRTVIRNPIEAWPKPVYEQLVFRSRAFGRETVFITEPDLVQQVLVEKADAFVKAQSLQRALRPALGDGILTADGARWRWQRRATAWPYDVSGARTRCRRLEHLPPQAALRCRRPRSPSSASVCRCAFTGKADGVDGSRSRRCSAKVVLSRSTSLEPPRWRSRPSAST